MADGGLVMLNKGTRNEGGVLRRPLSTPRTDTMILGSRARSVPASLRTAQRSDHNSVNQTGGRPQTALGTVRGECDRLQELEHEVTRKHNLESHLPLKKSKPPPWQKTLDVSPSPCVVMPSYVLSRSKNRVAMVIKTDEFFDQDVPEKETKPSPERDSLVSELQRQIDDLTLFLEEERLNHRETKRKAAEQLRDRTEDLQRQHQNDIRCLQEEHTETIAGLRGELLREMSGKDEKSESAIQKMRTELEFLQGAFESYKSQLHQETDEKWHKKESDLQHHYEETIQKRMHELRARVIAEKNADRAELEKSNMREMQELRKEHKRDMDSLLRRFSNAAADMKRLKEVEAELQVTKQSYEETQRDYDEVCQQVTQLTRELTDTKVKLMSFEEHFQEKVQQIDEKYKGQIHDLMMQNTEIRRLYVQKCGQLYDEKEMSEQTRLEQVETAKDAMRVVIQTRNRTLVNLTAMDPDQNDLLRKPKHRPSSAPATQSETTTAVSCASETAQFCAKIEEKIRRQVLNSQKPNNLLAEISKVSDDEDGDEDDEDDEDAMTINSRDVIQYMLHNT